MLSGKNRAKDIIGDEDYEKVKMICKIFNVEMNNNNIQIFDNEGETFEEQGYKQAWDWR
jgi:hypothetical protein